MLSYAGNITKIISHLFLFKNAVCQLGTLCLFPIVPYFDGNY